MIAYARSHGDATVAVAVTRWFAKLNATVVKPVGDAWIDTVVEAPGPGEWFNVLTGEHVPAHQTGEEAWLLAGPALFRTIPWAVLVPA